MKEVFDMIVGCLRDSRTFPTIAESDGSFENWILWEAYAACTTRGHKCSVTPRYQDSNKRGDLLVRRVDGHDIMIEFKIIGDCTQDKYIHAINDDYRKLESLATGIEPCRGLLIVVMTSPIGNILKRPSWTDWLPRLEFWVKPSLKYQFYFGKQGQALIYGWPVV
ncbi:MAG: hypothetical protein M0006_13690 [Magnetospirillum sp.]|nr:hypothetical protein [Magnetospirillum sp.]